LSSFSLCFGIPDLFSHLFACGSCGLLTSLVNFMLSLPNEHKNNLLHALER
jgi:hypothetical protein